jgi:hypothetical protein
MASSGVTRPQAPGGGAERSEGKQTGGPQHKGMPAVSKSYAHEKPFCGSLAENRASHNRAKAEVDGEELVKCTRRTAGIGGAALQKRKTDQSGTVPLTSRGWCKRQGRFL